MYIHLWMDIHLFRAHCPTFLTHSSYYICFCFFVLLCNCCILALTNILTRDVWIPVIKYVNLEAIKI